MKTFLTESLLTLSIPRKKKTKLERFHINYLMVTSEALEKQDQTTHQKT